MKTKFLVLTAAVTILFFASCSKSGSSSQPASNPNSINITGMSFPATVTIKQGSTVTWHNKDGIAHTVTSDDATTFDSGTLPAGSSFSYTPNTAGTYSYHCNFHSGMKGTLIVTP
ncbi:MAG TPA: cupredoxin domain-containing protein [Hanamia sp.]|nr:cupredoxin domain-containing protein [Hanamia sp.]